MNSQFPQLPTTQEGWDDLLNQLYCGMPVHISAAKGSLQVRMRMEVEDDDTCHLLVVLGLYRPYPPKSPSISESSEFFELGGQRIMLGFDPWEARQASGVPLLQKAVEDITRSVIKNAILDLACDVDDWRDSVRSMQGES